MASSLQEDDAGSGGKIAELRRAPLFADLHDETLASIADASYRYVCARGPWMVGERDARERLFVVARGSVRLYRCTCKGDEATLAVKHDGALFDLGARDHKGNPKNCIEALAGDTVIYGVPRAYLVDLGLTHPDFMLRMTKLLAELIGEYQDIIADLMLHGVEIRVAHGLARLDGPRGAVELTRCQLATVFAASREEIGRALKKLRATGLVAYEDNGRRFHLPDKTRLATLDEDADL